MRSLLFPYLNGLTHLLEDAEQKAQDNSMAIVPATCPHKLVQIVSAALEPKAL